MYDFRIIQSEIKESRYTNNINIENDPYQCVTYDCQNEYEVDIHSTPGMVAETKCLYNFAHCEFHVVRLRICAHIPFLAVFENGASRSIGFFNPWYNFPKNISPVSCRYTMVNELEGDERWDLQLYKHECAYRDFTMCDLT